MLELHGEMEYSAELIKDMQSFYCDHFIPKDRQYPGLECDTPSPIHADIAWSTKVPDNLRDQVAIWKKKMTQVSPNEFLFLEQPFSFCQFPRLTI